MIAKYALLADSASRSMDGKLSIMGIFKNISATKFPANHDSMTLIVECEAGLNDVGVHQIRFKFRDSDGQIQPSINVPQFNIPKPPNGTASGTLVFEMHIQNMMFRKPGSYELAIFCDDEYLTSVDFTLKLIKFKNQ